jgi:CRP-like cAMP-binding protein
MQHDPPHGPVGSSRLLTNLLEQLGPDDRSRFIAAGRERVVAADEEIARQGSVGDCLFVVESGELAIVRRVPGNEEETLETARDGALVGELSVLDRRPRSASLRATTTTRVRVIELRAFESLVLDGGAIGSRVLRAIAAALHERLCGARAAAARRFETAATATWACDHRCEAPQWQARALVPAPAMLAPFAAELEYASLPASSQWRLGSDSGPACIAVVLRGALSPCLVSAAGDAIVLPVVAPGSFVDASATVGAVPPALLWRTRSRAVLARLPLRCFGAGDADAARLLYALCRDLATSLRSTTALAMHLGMAWDGARVAAASRAARAHR